MPGAPQAAQCEADSSNGQSLPQVCSRTDCPEVSRGNARDTMLSKARACPRAIPMNCSRKLMPAENGILGELVDGAMQRHPGAAIDRAAKSGYGANTAAAVLQLCTVFTVAVFHLSGADGIPADRRRGSSH
jgi:hypothetical protein